MTTRGGEAVGLFSAPATKVARCLKSLLEGAAVFSSSRRPSLSPLLLFLLLFLVRPPLLSPGGRPTSPLLPPPPPPRRHRNLTWWGLKHEGEVVLWREVLGDGLIGFNPTRFTTWYDSSGVFIAIWKVHHVAFNQKRQIFTDKLNKQT